MPRKSAGENVPVLYKIMPRQDWEAAQAKGVYEGSEVDRQDGFIHLSAVHQVRETARKHFSGKNGLLLVSVRDEALGGTLKWEASRGGDLFPHVYGPIDPAAALWVKPLPLVDGVHQFPAEAGA